MLKNLNKGLALFMAIAVMALNLGLINDVLANELDGLEGTDQALARPIKGVSDSTPQPVTPLVTQPSNGGNAPAITTVNPVLTTEYCDSMFASLKMVQSVDHSTGAFDANDLNGDGFINLTDTVLLAQLDLGGQNGTPDGVINLTDVVLFSQKCGNLLTPAPEPMLVDTVSVDHKPWCSALLGVMKGVGNQTLRDNKVVDINNDGVFNGLDVGLAVQLYTANDDSACQASFHEVKGDYKFDTTNYTRIDWCGGLMQGIKDYFAGSTYNPMFDLNEVGDVISPDGVINGSDVAWAAAHNDQAHCYLHYGLPDLTPNTNITTPVPTDHGNWCSALLGVMKGVGNESLRNNAVIDIDGNGYFDGRDVGLGVQLYYNNDNAACKARFQSASTTAPTTYNFNADNYTHIDWCGGLLQGIRDYFAGSTYSPMFDLNEVGGVISPDGVINGSDVAWAAQHNNQAHCYLHYGFPADALATTTPIAEPVVPSAPEINNGNGNHGGNNLLNYVPNPVLVPAPQVLGEKVVECKNKANTTLTQFKEGTLVRGCGPEIYIIKDGKKVHIINLETLRSKYFGKKILNIGDLINDIKDSSVKVVSAKK